MRSLPLLAAPLLALMPLTLSAAEAPKKAVQADAAAPQSLGTNKNWSAFSAGSGKTQVCYLVGKPVKTLPEHVQRGRIAANITHRPGENTFNTVNFQLGYDAKAGLNAELTIDGKKFDLFTAKQGAWAADAATDKNVTIALSKGKEAVIKAVSEHNNSSTDTYSLDGFAPTLALIDKACNVKR
ncbi:MAG TPA: invasion associated locus B family protein [Stellaceae bacterium]|jgi:invasion protein IalB|nr:invasion associated locus B family protein [Stellaceae bacterium]